MTTALAKATQKRPYHRKVEYNRGKRKITADEAAKIAEDPRNNAAIGRDYGISREYVRQIKTGVVYKKIEANRVGGTKTRAYITKERFLALMRKTDLTKKALSKVIGRHQTSLYQWANGYARIPQYVESALLEAVDAYHNPAEKWKPVPGFPLYEASSLGRLRSATTGVVYALTWNERRGCYVYAMRYYDYAIQADTTGEPVNNKVVGVARIICWTFKGPPDHWTDMPVHKDGDKGNLRASNLKWVPRFSMSHPGRFPGEDWRP